MARYPFICVLAVSWLVGASPFLAAQNNQRPPQRQQRKNLVTPVAKQQKLSPELEKLLADWERHSSQVKTLEGEHTRITYDTVFFVAKRSHGKFFYEAPDKGRIDLIGDKDIPKGAKIQRINPQTRKKEVFDLKPDQSEMWICNGENITQIDVDEKQGSRFEIPPNQRGENIINGPLPFVFGMKAAAAKQRYFLKLVNLDAKQKTAWLDIRPRKSTDRANWKMAQVILSTQTYLPLYVQLVDPAGTKETIFKFEDIAVNKKGNIFRSFFKGDPFRPRLVGVKIKDFQPQGVVPNVVGFSWKNATMVLKNAGFDIKTMVEPKRGVTATRPQLIWVVYDQSPKARSVLMKGNKIELTLYTKPPETAAATKTARK